MLKLGKMLSGNYILTNASLGNAYRQNQFQLRKPLIGSTMFVETDVSPIQTLAAGQTWCAKNNRLDLGTSETRQLTNKEGRMDDEFFMGIDVEVGFDNTNQKVCYPKNASAVSFLQRTINEVKEKLEVIDTLQKKGVTMLATLVSIEQGAHHETITRDVIALPKFLEAHVLIQLTCDGKLQFPISKLFLEWQTSYVSMEIFVLEPSKMTLTNEQPSLGYKLVLVKDFFEKVHKQLVR